jgi:WD40 repeat protein
MSSSFEHQDSVVSVERNPTKTDMFLTAAKDGYIIVWELKEDVLEEGEEDNSDKDEMFKFLEDCDFNQPMTKAKWLTDKSIIAATTTGKLLVFTIEKATNPYGKK